MNDLAALRLHGQPDADGREQRRCPGTRRNDHAIGLDCLTIDVYSLHAAPAQDKLGRALHRSCSAADGSALQGRRHQATIDTGAARHEKPWLLRAKRREQLAGVSRRKSLDLPGLRGLRSAGAQAPFGGLELGRSLRHVEAADAGIAEVLLAILTEHGHQLGVVASAPGKQGIVGAFLDRRPPGTDDAGARRGRAALVRPIDQRHLCALACEMIGGAGAQNAGAHDDDFHAPIPPLPLVLRTAARPRLSYHRPSGSAGPSALRYRDRG